MKNKVRPVDLHWLRMPEVYVLGEDKVVMATPSGSSFHALSFSSTDPVGMICDPKSRFTATLRFDFRFNHAEDECGIFLRQSDRRWAKAGVENRGDRLDLAATVYGMGFGDRCSREIGSGIDSIYLRLHYWQGNVRFQWSMGGVTFTDMRMLHFSVDRMPVQFGFYSCAPNGPGFDCTVSNIEIYGE